MATNLPSQIITDSAAGTKLYFDRYGQSNFNKKTTLLHYKRYDNEIIEGIFYEKELQKVFKEDNYYKYDQILKTRIKNGVKEYFVSWQGYPSKFNSWVRDLVK